VFTPDPDGAENTSRRSGTYGLDSGRFGNSGDRRLRRKSEPGRVDHALASRHYGVRRYVTSRAAMIFFEVALRATVSRRLRCRGDRTARVWRGALGSAFAWLGVILLVAAVRVTAAGILMLLAVVIAVVQIARGVRDFPAVWRFAR
jgi:hypothetical protein